MAIADDIVRALRSTLVQALLHPLQSPRSKLTSCSCCARTASGAKLNARSARALPSRTWNHACGLHVGGERVAHRRSGGRTTLVVTNRQVPKP